MEQPPFCLHFNNHAMNEALPHGFLYVLDEAKISRILRPMKAKIAAIQLAIKTAPSYGFSITNGTRQQTPPVEDDLVPRHRHRHHGTTTQRSKRSINRPASSISAINISAGTASNVFTTASSLSKAVEGVESLVKRYQASLQDHLRDVMEAVWWRPFCEDYDLPLDTVPGSSTANQFTRVYSSLGIECAFQVGRLVAQLDESQSELAEKYYRLMPAYMRRFAVLEHIVELCILHIPVGQLLLPLAEMCVKFQADRQAIRLLYQATQIQNSIFQLDFSWAYQLAYKARSAGIWIDLVRTKSVDEFFWGEVFLTLLPVVDAHHRARLMHSGFQVYMKRHDSSRKIRLRVASWTATLIADSLEARFRPDPLLDDDLNEVNVSKLRELDKATVETCEYVVGSMARYLFSQSDIDDRATTSAVTKLEGVALALALHTLYTEISKPIELVNVQEMDFWVRVLDAFATETRLTDFDVVIQSYKVLPNLNALAKMLVDVNLNTLAIGLLNRMMNEYIDLEHATLIQQGYENEVTVESLETLLRQAKFKSEKVSTGDEWVYDDMLDEWIQKEADETEAKERHPQPARKIPPLKSKTVDKGPVRLSTRDSQQLLAPMKRLETGYALRYFASDTEEEGDERQRVEEELEGHVNPITLEGVALEPADSWTMHQETSMQTGHSSAVPLPLASEMDDQLLVRVGSSSAFEHEDADEADDGSSDSVSEVSASTINSSPQGSSHSPSIYSDDTHMHMGSVVEVSSALNRRKTSRRAWNLNHISHEYDPKELFHDSAGPLCSDDEVYSLSAVNEAASEIMSDLIQASEPFDGEVEWKEEEREYGESEEEEETNGGASNISDEYDETTRRIDTFPLSADIVGGDNHGRTERGVRGRKVVARCRGKHMIEFSGGDRDDDDDRDSATIVPPARHKRRRYRIPTSSPEYEELMRVSSTNCNGSDDAFQLPKSQRQRTR